MYQPRKTPERRTYSQDRYYILIKRQKAGKATFSELTELDEIVNRVPDIREKVIIENFYVEDDIQDPDYRENINNFHSKRVQERNFWNRLRAAVSHIFTSQFSIIKPGKTEILF